MRTRDTTYDVMSLINIRDPVTHCFIHRVLQCLRPGDDGHNLRAEQLHSKNIRLLPLDINRTHIDRARQIEQRANGRRSDTVLPGAGFGNNPRLSHTLGQQDLANAIVDLVAAGMI